jgi:hypothetical protein
VTVDVDFRSEGRRHSQLIRSSLHLTHSLTNAINRADCCALLLLVLLRIVELIGSFGETSGTIVHARSDSAQSSRVECSPKKSDQLIKLGPDQITERIRRVSSIGNQTLQEDDLRSVCQEPTAIAFSPVPALKSDAVHALINTLHVQSIH